MYYGNMCQEFRHNSTKLWKIINGIAGKIQNKNELIERISVDNIQYETGPEIANEFAKHFPVLEKDMPRVSVNPSCTTKITLDAFLVATRISS